MQQLAIFQLEKTHQNGPVRTRCQNLARFVEVKMVCAERAAPYNAPISRPENAAMLGEMIIGDSDREKAVAVSLNVRNEVNAVEIVAVGSVTEIHLKLRDVFKSAILANAVGMIFIHNHPGGDLTPSPEDIAITARLVEAGNLLGIEILDHIIIGGKGRFTSLRETHPALFKVQDKAKQE